ncbi:MAG: HYExAFE family protein [Planctomycetaceae bacterium]|nr:HYExAFE family protein [Planctomycetaceae bacterium]
MAKRENHYEAAFEAYLRWLAVPYIAVDETHRTLIGRDCADRQQATGRPSLKSLDFVVSPPRSSGSWLVDVKGRRFPTGKSYYKNWSTADELSSLAAWEDLFAAQAKGLLVFAYNVVGDRAPLAAEELFVFRGGLYGFVGIELAHYASWSKQLSPRWGTVTVPVAQFRSLARPARELFGAPRPQAA